MATIQQFDTDKQKQLGQPQTTTSPSDGSISTSSSPSASPSAAQPEGQRQGSGRFTNLSQYVNANQGAGQQLAQGIQQNVDKQAEKVGQSVAAASGVQQGIAGEQNRIGQADDIAKNISALGTGGGDVAKAQQNIAAANQLRTGTTAVGDLRNQANNALGAINQNVQNVNTLANQSGNEQGRFDLLKNTYGRPGYGQGAQRLDQLFVQNGGTQTLNNLQQGLQNTAQQGQQQYGQISNQLNGGLSQAEIAAQNAQKKINETLGTYGSKGEGALGNVYSTLQAAAQNAKKDQDDLVNTARTQFGTGTLDANIASALGIKDGDYLGSINLNDYGNQIRGAKNEFSQADVITPEQQQRLDILRQMSGLDEKDINLGVKNGAAGLDFAGKDNFNQQQIDNKNLLTTHLNNTGYDTGRAALDAIHTLLNSYDNKFYQGNRENTAQLQNLHTEVGGPEWQILHDSAGENSYKFGDIKQDSTGKGLFDQFLNRKTNGYTQPIDFVNKYGVDQATADSAYQKFLSNLQDAKAAEYNKIGLNNKFKVRGT